MFWRGVWGYLPVQAVQALVGFGAVIAFTRLLSPEDYGRYALAYSVAALSQTAFLTWGEAAMARFTVAEIEGGTLGVHVATLNRALVGMIAVVGLVTAPLLIFLPLDSKLKLAIAAGVAAFALRSLLKLSQERKRACGEVRGFAVLDMTATGGGFILGIALAAVGWGGAGPLAATGIVTAACLAWLLPGELRISRGANFDPARVRRYAAYGLPVALSLIAALALATTDRFLIAGFLDEASVGAYHAGYSVGNRLIDVIFVWLGLAGGPALVAALERGGGPALRHAANQQAEFLVLVALPACVGLALVSGPLIGILVGEQLRDQAAAVTPWIAVAAFFAGVQTHYFAQAFTLSRRTGLLAATVAVPAAINIGLNLLLIPRFGVIGAAWATALSYAIGAAVSAVLGRRVMPLPLPWAAFARSALAAGVMAAVVLSLPAFEGWMELLVKSATGGLVYALATLALDGELRRRALKLLTRPQGRTA